jgi:hypothetical protein
MTAPSKRTELVVDKAVPTSVPMRDVLGRIGHELAHVTSTLDQLQELIGPLVRAAAGQDVLVLHQAQSIDYVRQRAAAISDFVAALAASAPCECHIDPAPAAQVVTLADLAARLGFKDEDDASGDARWGDFEMF